MAVAVFKVSLARVLKTCAVNSSMFLIFDDASAEFYRRELLKGYI